MLTFVDRDQVFHLTMRYRRSLVLGCILSIHVGKSKKSTCQDLVCYQLDLCVEDLETNQAGPSKAYLRSDLS